MSDGQECQQCRRSFRRCECGRYKPVDQGMTLDQLIKCLSDMRQLHAGTTPVSVRNTDGEWDECYMAMWDTHPVHGTVIEIHSMEKHATG